MADVQEQDLLPPAEGLVGRKATLQLTENEKVMLVNWAHSAEYSVFLRLAEALIEADETKHFQLWRDKEAFERTGLVAVAQRLFFERLQKEVNTQFEEFQGELEFIKNEQEINTASPEEIIQRGFR